MSVRREPFPAVNERLFGLMPALSDFRNIVGHFSRGGLFGGEAE